ncbi:MAG: 4-alpha-glucanotransferase [Mixta calida]|uniref:4-alpha-glucanotransferase n=1 Tax=Mixta TaxID=2100764 RepID=UPI000536285B|nr:MULTISPECIES: 4-alpha-glucanotransferase [Mixta]AIX75602.1 4-alpha-glucanotransferase [Pantoea sp. PSNIH2]MBS6058989.1 4-alpha-glucanotransferase [Pantoea sp.]POU50644.1 4-alpha-glucanotransferase [Pantoea sp. PSNIH5]POU69197.1 4-alpha-glucanotransferase [Pantoea sp. PSNIH4]POY69194.1 4-alpha-glucanotransferase [Pantoea sp. PSNIH3]
MDLTQLEKDASAAGIAASYINAKGEPEAISAETRQKLLEAMGFPRPVSDAPVPAVKVFSGRRKRELAVGGSGPFRWTLQTEQGKTYQGEARGGETFPLPPRLPQGYHQLTLTQGENAWPCRIIMAPRRCYEPQALLEGRKLWGACVQLYTLRSARNWGIGDFGDLSEMLAQIAERGGDFIGLNPIHSLYPASPESASPYSPSSRRWMNVIYIDVERVPDFQQSEEAQRWWRDKETQRRVKAARETEWVDYSAVNQLKIDGLRLAWAQFSTRDEQDATRRHFEAYIAAGGESLYSQAAYDALHAAMLKEDGQRWGWPAWPEKYRHAQSKAVQQFCRKNEDEVRFWLWLQWLANRQFDECWQVCQRHGMSVGLYRDLAVGVAEGGAETWSDPDLYCLKASVGAPPDILGPLGQNWGLPPMDPHVMAARAYQPFIDMLRANMASCGALRIDHVMSMLRLWWIPYGQTADHGAYVYYPVDDLLAILALESHRNRCMVIGEDLGTVPKEIIGKLRSGGIYSWKVLYFEQESADRYRAPQEWQRQAMASATTHDLPTLRGFWSAGDLTLGETLGLYPDKVVLKGLYENRERQKQALLDALHEQGCVPKKLGKRAVKVPASAELSRGMQRYIAESASALLGLQPEDWLEMEKPVNVPGTVDQYPNWRRKLSRTLEEMFNDEQINRLIKDLDKRRRAS